MQVNPDSRAEATIAGLLRYARDCLRELDSGRLDAELLLAHTLNTGRTVLYAHPRRQVPAGQAADFRRQVGLRLLDVPVAYLTGMREFWSLELTVTRNTLIPRPETELLVETALALIPPAAVTRVLDLGTGSGAIAIAISRERSHCRVTATDISLSALEVARANALRHACDLELRCADWLAGFTDESFDLILSNPPYVDTLDQALSGALRHEPRLALDGGRHGLACYRRIIPAARRHLAAGGCLVLEHGCEQGPGVRELLRANGYRDILTLHDAAGLERVTRASV